MKASLTLKPFRPLDPCGYYRCLRTATLLHGYTPRPAGCVALSEALYLQCCHTLAALQDKNAELIDLHHALERN